METLSGSVAEQVCGLLGMLQCSTDCLTRGGMLLQMLPFRLAGKPPAVQHAQHHDELPGAASADPEAAWGHDLCIVSQLPPAKADTGSGVRQDDMRGFHGCVGALGSGCNVLHFKSLHPNGRFVHLACLSDLRTLLSCNKGWCECTAAVQLR